MVGGLFLGLSKEKGACLVVHWLRMPCNARDIGSIPGPGRNQCWGIINPGASTTESTHGNYRSWCTQSLTSTREVTAMRNPHTEEEQAPLVATRESPQAATRLSISKKIKDSETGMNGTHGAVSEAV